MNYERASATDAGGRQTEEKGGQAGGVVDQGWAAWATIARVSVKFLVAFIY